MDNDLGTRKAVADWQATIISIWCDTIKDETSIVVYPDWRTYCSHYETWGPVQKEERKGIGAMLAWLGIVEPMKSIVVNGCEGSGKCPKVLEYRDNLMCESFSDKSTLPES